MANVHTPERQAFETMEGYRERRAQSKRQRAWRRAAIKACGGIRQYKRAVRAERLAPLPSGLVD